MGAPCLSPNEEKGQIPLGPLKQPTGGLLPLPRRLAIARVSQLSLEPLKSCDMFLEGFLTPDVRPFRPLTAPDMAPVWGPRMSMHWGGLVDLGLTEAQGSQGPPEASWPCPSTGALYTVAG